MALCPSPCLHTHFPLHTDAAQLTRGQAAGVSKSPKGRPGRKRTRGQAGYLLWPEHPSQQGAALPDKVPAQEAPLTIFLVVSFQEQISIFSLFTYPLLLQGSFQSPTVFMFPSLSLGELCILLKPSSPFLELQVPVGLSKMEKTSSLLLFHQRAVKRSLLGALLLSPQKNGSGIEAEG